MRLTIDLTPLQAPDQLLAERPDGRATGDPPGAVRNRLHPPPICSVVLGHQRVPLDSALYNAKSATAAESVHPLVWDGQKLMPSVTRVFSRTREMVAYLQAYERMATSTQPLVATVSFYRGDVKAFETPATAVSDGLDARSKAVPLRLTVPLEALMPGRYECQVTVLDPIGQKAAFWRAPIVIVP